MTSGGLSTMLPSSNTSVANDTQWDGKIDQKWRISKERYIEVEGHLIFDANKPLHHSIRINSILNLIEAYFNA